MKINLLNARSFVAKRLLINIMRVFIFFMCATVFSFSSSDLFSQEKVLIDSDQLVTVDQVFKIIKKQTNYRFIYPKKAFKNVPKVQLRKGEIELNELLKKSLLNNNLSFELTANNNILIKKNTAISSHIKKEQEIISGIVNDANGLPLPGATILIKGTNSGTLTDFNGKYSISCNRGATLVFSYVGYSTQEIVVGTTNTINVTMQESAETLGEVIVTALGIKREKKALGYSVQEINGEDLTEARESNISNALSGKIAGVQVTASSGSVGASSRVVLRGNSSITGNNEPLYVVDGFPIDNRRFGTAHAFGGVDLPNGAADISPDDIESVTVLKGPNAAALYGLRAGNGVIVITTKKGKGVKKFEVSINSNTTFSTPLVLPDFQNSYGQGNNPKYFEYTDGANGDFGDGIDESWGPPLDIGLKFIQWNSQLSGGQPLPWVSHPDNVKNFLDTGVKHSNNVSFSNKNFRLSIGNTDEQGMMPNTELKKITIGVGGSLEIGKHMLANVSLNYFNTDSDNLPVSGFNQANPFLQFISGGRQVDYQELRNWRSFPIAPANTDSAGSPLNWNHNFHNNPYWLLDTNLNTFEKDRLIGNIDLSYQLTDWLSFNQKIGVDSYSQLETNREAFYTNSAPRGSYIEKHRRFEEINAISLLSVKETINKDFSFSTSLGFHHMNRKYNLISGYIPSLELPNLYNLRNLQSGATASLNNIERNQQINSVFGYGQLSYKEMVFLDFTARNDWASILPIKNNSFFYPSVSTSVLLSKMFDLQSAKIDFLKIRGSWSKVGSTGALVPYSVTQSFNLRNSGFGNQANLPNTQFNPKLKAENVIGIEFGLDAKLFSNRLRLNASYYDQQSEDLIVPIRVSSTTGFTNAWDNVADMSNKGVEIQLGGSVIKNDDFSFDIDLNFARNENKVVSLRGLDSFIIGGQWGTTVQARPGLPYGVFVGRDFERAPNGQIIYQDGLPLIDDGTQKILGNIAPDWTGGANFTIKYKNFSFSTLIDAKIGGEVNSMTYAWGRYAGTLKETLIGREIGLVGNGVKSDGNGGYIPNDVVVNARVFNKASYGNNVESNTIFDASYIKLRQINLSYNLPSKILKILPFKAIRLSLVGRNLAILYKKVPHIDPETGFSGSNGNLGIEFGQSPSARSVGFNINLKF